MILYLDTSALVKRYFREEHSNDVIDAWKSASHIATSFVAYAETLSCMHRKQREGGIDKPSLGKIINAFHGDWASFIRIEANEELSGYLDRAMEKYPLLGFDAIHLVSAQVIREKISGDFLFACFDKQLARAATSEGLITFPHANSEIIN